MARLKISLLAATLIIAACAPSPKDQSKNNSGQSYVTGSVGSGLLSPEVLVSRPSISGTFLAATKISPDGAYISYLASAGKNPAQNLWALDLESGENILLVAAEDVLGAPEQLSEEEKNRRERARIYASGIIAYSWVDASTLMFPLGGDIYLYDLGFKTTRRVTETEGFETDPKLSGDNSKVAYVRDNDLYVTDIASGAETRLTDDATDVIRNATASFVVQEELGRYTGYWWSPENDKIVYTQIDESPIAIENRIDFGPDGVSNIAQRYPFAGTDNATIKLGVKSLSGGETIWADIGDDPDIYLTRLVWAPDGSAFFAGILSRDHKTHRFYKVDPVTGSSSVHYEETSKTWLNIGASPEMLESGSMLWTSESSGKRQIYEIGADGQARQITPDNVLVKSLSCIDEPGQKLYFTGWQDTPLNNHAFSIDMSGENLTQITEKDGSHIARFSENCERYIGTHHDQDTPPQTRAYNNEGEPLFWLTENKLDGTHPYAPYLEHHAKAEFGQIDAKDGTKLDYILIKPYDLKPGEKRPSITIVYGGPGVQRVANSWGRSLYGRMLAHHGFVVFQIDGRGAAGRGKAFEDHLYRAMGRAEVIDQSAGAKWLKQQDFIDPDRMGVYGWSYDGYMSLHMLAQTDHYRSGVSGAPVTDWALYDTAYTERYLGSPNPDDVNYTQGAYEKGSVFPYLDGLTEEFLLIHGMADDNVVFRHSVKLIDAMQDRVAQNMRVMTYPGEKHGFRRDSNRLHRDHQIIDFFVETLGE
ncbi:MAG: prolyl oligopeptidase family serine peptidase [Hellea sp.]|nr:prolyl oligopeptidase family serine peptidase [Hellea sp.]